MPDMQHINFQDLTEWTNEEFVPNSQVLNKLERTSLRALISYVAYTHQVDEGLVLSIVATHLGMHDFKSLGPKDYEIAVRYLVGLNPKTVVN